MHFQVKNGILSLTDTERKNIHLNQFLTDQKRNMNISLELILSVISMERKNVFCSTEKFQLSLLIVSLMTVTCSTFLSMSMQAFCWFVFLFLQYCVYLTFIFLHLIFFECVDFYGMVVKSLVHRVIQK